MLRNATRETAGAKGRANRKKWRALRREQRDRRAYCSAVPRERQRDSPRSAVRSRGESSGGTLRSGESIDGFEGIAGAGIAGAGVEGAGIAGEVAAGAGAPDGELDRVGFDGFDGADVDPCGAVRV